MAIFDRINDFAKNLSERADDAIEASKLNNKASAETKAAQEEYRKIGEFYYNLFISGEELAPEVTEFCLAAKAHHEAAAQAISEIERMKKEKEAKEKEAMEQAEMKENASSVCPSCGAVNPENTKFCSQCGTKLEKPAPIPEGAACPECGALNPEGTKFCSQCGTKLENTEAPKLRLCPGCGVEVPSENRFCPECGQKMD